LIRLKVAGDDGASESGQKAQAAEPPRRTGAIETQADGAVKSSDAIVAEQAKSPSPPSPVEAPPSPPVRTHRPPAPRAEGEKPIASPAVRSRAREAGIDLRQVAGTGPAGRITHEDLETFLAHGPQVARMPGLVQDTSVQHVKV